MVCPWAAPSITSAFSSTDEASRANEGERECGTNQADILFLNRARGAGQMESLVAVVSRMFVKYWIYVCGTMFFFVSFEGTIVVYKVIYMVLFLCCVALYQVRIPDADSDSRTLSIGRYRVNTETVNTTGAYWRVLLR